MIDKNTKVAITFVADISDLEKIKELQKQATIFNRSEMLRKIMKVGLQVLEKDSQAV